MSKVTPHPAKFSDAIVQTIAQIIDEQCPKRAHVLDPFAGVGRVHELQKLCTSDVLTVGVEIEDEWASQHPQTLVGNALSLPRGWSRRYDVVATSPCYGNRMADHHEANDACSQCRGGGLAGDGVMTCRKCGGTGLSPRRSYTHDLGRPLSPANSGSLHWGPSYRRFHEAAWREVRRVLKRRGVFILNVKDHVRDGELQRVSSWHRRFIESIGFERLETWTIDQNGLRHGANRLARAKHEHVYVFEKASRRD